MRTHREEERGKAVTDMAFELVKHLVLREGGDGGGLVLCEDYETLADLFEAREAGEGERWFTRRTDSPGRVTFYNDQEFVTFAAAGPDPSAYDVVLRMKPLWSTKETEG